MIMKKNIFKLFSAMVVSATVLTGCIEEVFPEDSTATSEQIGASATALEAAVSGMPSQMVQGYLVNGSVGGKTRFQFQIGIISCYHYLISNYNGTGGC